MDDHQDVDSLRLHLFAFKGKSFHSMPPGSDALKLHTLRAEYQGGHIWGKTLVPVISLPSPKEWGWIDSPARFHPRFTSIDTITRKLPSLRMCGCQVKCEPPCTCCVLGVRCKGLCGCQGECFGKRRMTWVEIVICSPVCLISFLSLYRPVAQRKIWTYHDWILLMQKNFHASSP